MATTPPKLPPLPQADPISDRGGKLTLPWNMFFVALLRYIQSNTQAIEGIELLGSSAGGGGVAGAGAAPAVDLTDAPSAEGTNNLGARSDHTHQSRIQAEDDGTDLGGVQAINVEGPLAYVREEPNITGSLLTDLYGAWAFDEESGTRAPALGTSIYLEETGGTVPSDDGRFGRAISGTDSDTFELGATGLSIPLSGGFSMALWFRWDYLPAPAAKPQTLCTLGPFASDIAFTVSRYYDSYFISSTLQWAAGAGGAVSLPTPRLGPAAEGEWHLLVFTYDAATGVFVGRLDEGCIKERTPFDSPSIKLSATVPPASLATANAVTLTTASFLKAISSNFENFEGRIDSPLIWTRTLTDAEVALLWTSRRATIGVDTVAVELFGG
jgi:hypothetical protein